ncbi:efflux RND transporter permease subunit [Reyranella soli]|uniref:efflux RND transporter permease subunit n=1 Tax=Reyranella soli TaxID=1230389 RepID=UPI0011BEAADF|nr:efflux RND transporter permease subunit [Reyranella soli]
MDALEVDLASAYVNDFNQFGRTYQVTARPEANSGRPCTTPLEDAATPPAHIADRRGDDVPGHHDLVCFHLGVVPLGIAVVAGLEMRQSLGTTLFFGLPGVPGFGLIFTPNVLRHHARPHRLAAAPPARSARGPIFPSEWIPLGGGAHKAGRRVIRKDHSRF